MAYPLVKNQEYAYDWEHRPVEVITSVQRRRRWSAEEKARIVQKTYAPGMSVSELHPVLTGHRLSRLAGGPRDKPRHVPMSDTFSKVEVITGVARRRRFSTELKLGSVAESMQPGMSVSYVARRHGLSPSPVFRWRRLMSEGGKEAVRADDDVVLPSGVRRLEERVRELERLLGKKTLENEILRDALDLAQPKNGCCARPRP